MLRKAFTIMMIFAISAHTGGEAFLYFWYLIGNASFEQAFCINRDRPEMQCHGQCHLNKIAQKDQEQKQPQAPNPASEEERLSVPYAQPEAFLFIPYHVFNNIEQHLFRYDCFFSKLLAHNIFHPPKGD